MVVSMRTMDVTVFNLFLNGRAHVNHVQLESQSLASPWVIAIEHDRVAFDFDDIENGFTAIRRTPAQLTAHFHARWKIFFGHGLQQAFVALTK